MAIIKTIDRDEATGELEEFYGTISGYIANILKVQSLSPKTLKTHYAFYRVLMFGRSPLSRAQRELIGVAVSQLNQCLY